MRFVRESGDLNIEIELLLPPIDRPDGIAALFGVVIGDIGAVDVGKGIKIQFGGQGRVNVLPQKVGNDFFVTEDIFVAAIVVGHGCRRDGKLVVFT